VGHRYVTRWDMCAWDIRGVWDAWVDCDACGDGGDGGACSACSVTRGRYSAGGTVLRSVHLLREGSRDFPGSWVERETFFSVPVSLRAGFSRLWRRSSRSRPGS
jgi:hypothetical protein